MFRSTLNLLILCLVWSIYCGSAIAQDEAPPPPPMPRGSGIYTRADPYGTETNDEKGSTVWGRVFYSETGRPVRHGWIGFSKIRELIPAPGEYVVSAFVLGTPPENIEEWFVQITKDAKPVTLKAREATTMNLRIPD